jgi:hypothetical protein
MLDNSKRDTKCELKFRSVKQNLSVIEREIVLTSENFSEVFERTPSLPYQRK